MKYLVLPAEIKVRDLLPRLFTGAVAALRHRTVSFIGKESTLWNIKPSLPRGAWFHKSMTIEDLGNIIELADLGFANYCEDAEGSDFSSSHFLRFRFEPTAFPLVEQLFLWGNTHRRLFDATFPDYRSRFVVTGSPRFDIMREPYAVLYRHEADQVRRKHGTFFLFNAAFNVPAVSFHSEDQLKKIFRLYSPDDTVFEMRCRFYEYRKRLFPRYAAMIREVGAAMPGTHFIVRPHPVEPVELWEQHVTGINNVAVVKEGSAYGAILAGSGLVHPGCTTGMESYVLGRASFRYTPIPDETATGEVLGYMNRFNECLASPAEVIERFRAIEAGQPYAYPASIDAGSPDDLSSLDGTLAATRLVDSIAGTVPRPPAPFELDAARRALDRHLAKRAEIQPTQDASYVSSKYAPLSLDDVTEVLDRLAGADLAFAGVCARDRGDEIFTLEFAPRSRVFDIPSPSVSGDPETLARPARSVIATERAYRSVAPLSRSFGLDRGSSICRYYIDRFLAENAGRIRGRVLEIGDDRYTRQFGHDVTASTVVSADPATPNALPADLATGDQLPVGAFDCFICTQTFQCIFDIQQAVEHAVATLAPGGTLLVTASGISQISRYDFDRWGEYWRLTTQSLEKLLHAVAPDAIISVGSRGNLAAAQAYLDGMPAEDMDPAVLDIDDPDYQLVVHGVLTKTDPSATGTAIQVQVLPDQFHVLRSETDQTRLYEVTYGPLIIRTNSLPSLATEIELIFQKKLYDFDAVREDPFVIDGGAHIGSFSMYTLSRYPGASVLAFEPEDKSWGHLNANLLRNAPVGSASRIRTVKKGLGGFDGRIGFDMRESDGSTAYAASTNSTVSVCRLSPYLDRPVDYLKLNIEGAELEVLREIEPRLHLVREICIEYHGFPEVGQRLHEVLEFLHRNGFRYLVHDLGAYFNPACQPPFRIEAGTRYYLIVYGRRLQDTPPPL